MIANSRILLIISGGIAAYKCLDLIRSLRRKGAKVQPILTKRGAEFVTPLSLATISQSRVHQNLFSLTEEEEISHIRLAQESDLVVIAPATADIIGKTANGLADDLATTVLLANNKPVLIAPAMNTRMWNNAATQRNICRLQKEGATIVGPNHGELAEGEVGLGRMAEPSEILIAIDQILKGPLTGSKVLVTSGPTHEPLDPVRYISNKSSGKQGHAIATACARLGADVILVSGPSAELDPPGVQIIHVTTARQMLESCLENLPVDIAICVAAVSDWRPSQEKTEKIKKENNKSGVIEVIELVENPDVLATLSSVKINRPKLVVGFAAETENILQHGKAKLKSKGCDWILANNVSQSASTFGSESNKVHFIIENKTGDVVIEEWPEGSKIAIATQLANRISDTLRVRRNDSN